MFQYVPIFHIFRTDVEKKEMKKLEMTLWFLKQFLVNCDEEAEEKRNEKEEEEKEEQKEKEEEEEEVEEEEEEVKEEEDNDKHKKKLESMIIERLMKQKEIFKNCK